MLLENTDGTQLVVAAGHKLHVYDTNDGDLLHALKGVSKKSNNSLTNLFKDTKTPYIAWLIPRMANDLLQEGKWHQSRVHEA